MATLDKYIGRLREEKMKHAIQSVTRPTNPTGEGYNYVIGFQSGLTYAEKLLNEVLEEEKKGDNL